MEVHRNLVEREERPSIGTVKAVAEAADVEPTELEPLFHFIDGEAMDELWESAAPDTTVTFDYEGFRVTLTDDGSVSVRPDKERPTQ